MNNETNDMPIFLDDDGPSEMPTYITTQTSVQTLGLREGESLQDAIDRRQKEEQEKEQS